MGLDLSHVPSDLVIYLANILVLFLILKVLVHNPVHNFLTARAQRIQTQMEDARKAEEDATKMKEEYALHLDEVRAESEEAFRQQRVEAAKRAEEIVDAAEKEAQGIVEAAREQAALEHKNALKDMQDEILDLASRMSGKILSREVTAASNRDIATEFFREVGM